MNVNRILKRTVAAGAAATIVGLGTLVVATPAHAMTKRACDDLWQQASHWMDLWAQSPSAEYADTYYNLGHTYTMIWTRQCAGYDF
jgi:hypothetical protein